MEIRQEIRKSKLMMKRAVERDEKQMEMEYEGDNLSLTRSSYG